MQRPGSRRDDAFEDTEYKKTNSEPEGGGLILTCILRALRRWKRSPRAVPGEVQEGFPVADVGAGVQGVVGVPQRRFWAKARGVMSQIRHGLPLQAADLGLYPRTLGSVGGF